MERVFRLPGEGGCVIAACNSLFFAYMHIAVRGFASGRGGEMILHDGNF